MYNEKFIATLRHMFNCKEVHTPDGRSCCKHCHERSAGFIFTWRDRSVLLCDRMADLFMEQHPEAVFLGHTEDGLVNRELSNVW